MKIRLTNCDPKRRDEIRAAIKFYAQKLFSERMKSNLEFHVWFVNGMLKREKNRGEIYPYIDGRRIRRFRFRIAADTTLQDQLMAIAHEMAHAKQYALGEMRDIGIRWTRWHDRKILDENIPYWDRPWEIDARGWETGLYAQWQLTQGKDNI